MTLPEAAKTSLTYNISVLGAGTMGMRIAFLLALKEHKVTLWNHLINEEIMTTLSKTSKIEGRFAGLNKDQIADALSRIKITNLFEDLTESLIIIEAILENLDIKKSLYQKLGQVELKADLIATNTSSLGVANLSTALKDKAKFLGLHFFNPPLMNKFVEICTTSETSAASLNLAQELLRSLDVESVMVPDVPGFIVNRILFSSINEAIRLVEEHNLDPKDVDTAMKTGTGANNGPLEVADQIGLDVCLSILKSFSESKPTSSFTVPALLKNYVEQGRLGKKSGSGFYVYKKS